MRMWEILEKDGNEFSHRGSMGMRESKDALEDAYKCGYKEGYKEAMKDFEEKSGSRMFGERMRGR